jgi:type IV pilus assembly protein PilM
MAAPNRILALDLGTQTVTLAEFQTGKEGGLVLTNYRTGELLGDPAVDSTRLAQAKMTIGEMVSSLGYKGAKVNYAISAQSVFTRFVKLPSVGEDQVDQIVGFEAQQNVPFPIDEVVWDYQLVDQGNSAEVEVVLVAIKSDLLDEINDAVEGSGLKTTVVDVSPMAIYNAYRYNYGEVPDCSLIIDIGARTTNLMFVEPRKVFSRSIPIGGSKVTEAIAKEFNEPVRSGRGAQTARWLRFARGYLRRPGRSGCGTDLEDGPEHDDPTPRGNLALDQLLQITAAWLRASARTALRRKRDASVHARVLSREAPAAGRVLQSPAQRPGRLEPQPRGDRQERAHAR